MILNDADLKMNFPLLQGVQCSSIDLTLGDEFALERTYDGIISPTKLPPEDETFISFRNAVILESGAFCLASTKEIIRMPKNMAGIVTGRSSFGRLGLSVETAGFVDAGFTGQITLEIVNHSRNRFMLSGGMRVAQLIVFKQTGVSRKSYNEAGRYQGQRGITYSKGI